MATLGQKVREFRRQRRMTQQELAEGIGTAAVISQVESERVVPPHEVVLQLSERLGINEDVFSEGAPDVHEAHRLLRDARGAMERREFADAFTLLGQIEPHESGPIRTELVLQYMAECLEGVRETSQAESYWDEVVRLKFEHNDVSTAVRTYYRIGNAYRQGKKYLLVRLCWERAATWLAEVEEPPGDIALRLYANLGKLYLQMGEPQRAYRYYMKARTADIQMSNMEAATVEHGLGNACLALGNVNEADAHFANAQHLYLSEGHERGVNQCRINAAICCQRKGKALEALELLSAMISNVSAKPDNLRLANALISRAQSHSSLGDQRSAIRDAQQALEVSRDADLQLEALGVLLQCASDNSPGDATEAAKRLYSASQASQAIGLSAAALRALRQQAFVSEVPQAALDAALRVADLATEYARRPQSFLIRFPEK